METTVESGLRGKPRCGQNEALYHLRQTSKCFGSRQRQCTSSWYAERSSQGGLLDFRGLTELLMADHTSVRMPLAYSPASL